MVTRVKSSSTTASSRTRSGAPHSPGPSIGRIAVINGGDTAGFWLAGDRGFAWFDPARPVWNALVQPGDVPLPVHDVVATRNHVWVATDIGVVRYEKRVLIP